MADRCLLSCVASKNKRLNTGQERQGGLASFSPGFEEIEHENGGQAWIVCDHLPGRGQPSDSVEQVDQQGGHECIRVDIAKQAIELLGQFVRYINVQRGHGESGRLGVRDRLRFQVERVVTQVDFTRPFDGAGHHLGKTEQAGVPDAREYTLIEVRRSIENPGFTVFEVQQQTIVRQWGQVFDVGIHGNSFRFSRPGVRF